VVYQRNHSRVGIFDDGVSAETKVLMVAALTRDGQDETCKRISIEDAEIVSKQLPYFVSVHTRKLFAALGVTEDFNIQPNGTQSTTTSWERIEYTN
jgi:hypothetical protein